MSGRRGELLAGAAAATLSLIAVVFVMRLWRMDLAVPITYLGDGNLFGMLIKGVKEHGWYLFNSDLGAPFGQHNQDFPVASGDTTHFLIVKLIGLFAGNYAAALNVYFLLGFALVAASAYWALRALGASTPSSIVCSVLFSLLPFHFIVGEAQPFDSAYWFVPPACFLAISVLEGRPLFARAAEPRRGVLAFASRRTLVTLALCVLVGSSGGNYYALFAAMLIALLAVLAAFRLRSLPALVPGLGIAILIAATVAVNALPTIVYGIEHGFNPDATKRRPAESELYSLSIASLVLPIPDHRVGSLAGLRSRYVNDSPISSVAAGPPLGTVTAIGFLILLGCILAFAVGAGSGGLPWRSLGSAAAATLIALLIATTGGFSIIFAHLISPQLRVWERFYPFIAFFSLLAIAILLDLAAQRLRGRARWAAPALLAVVLVGGVVDQTSDSNAAWVPPYSATAAEFDSDADLTASIERRLPEGAEVFQLPYVPYPVATRPGREVDYDGARPYLHSSQLHWSYGSMLGRPEDWQAALMDKPLGLVVDSLAAAGFSGVLVDRYAYPDDAARWLRVLTRLTGAHPLLSPDRRFAFFDTRAYARRLARAHPPAEMARLRDATLHPLGLDPGSASERYTPPGGGRAGAFSLLEPSGSLELVNPAESSRRALLRMRLEGPAGQVLLTGRLADGTTVSSRGRGTALRVPPGHTEVELNIGGRARGGPAIVWTTLLPYALRPFAADGAAAPLSPQPPAQAPGGPAAPGASPAS